MWAWAPPACVICSSRPKSSAPAIVFIDEIDAVGRQRGSGLGGGHDEREQTLNQLLVEMDGFGANEGVVVLAATNRRGYSGPGAAAARAGLTGRSMWGCRTSRAGRRSCRSTPENKPLAEDVDLSGIARGTAGFTGADLENLLNEAALLAGRRNEPVITHEGPCRSPSSRLSPGRKSTAGSSRSRERRLTAYHEAGHAVVMHALPGLDPVHQITIVPRGEAGGMTI